MLDRINVIMFSYSVMARQLDEYYYFTEGASPVSPFIVRSGEDKYYYYYDNEGTSSVPPSVVQRGENWAGR